MRKERFINNYIKYFAYIIMVFMLASCTLEKSKGFGEKDIEIKVALFRRSNEIYLFKIDSDGVFEVLFGNRYTDDFTDSNNIDVVKIENKVLSEEELTGYKKLITKIKDFEPSEGVFRDAWEVVINYDDEKYRFTYGAAKDGNLDELVTMLIKNSPFEIVDSIGDSIKPVNWVN